MTEERKMDEDPSISEVKDEILSYVCNEISDAAIDYDSVVFTWKDKYQARIIVEVEEV